MTDQLSEICNRIGWNPDEVVGKASDIWVSPSIVLPSEGSVVYGMLGSAGNAEDHRRETRIDDQVLCVAQERAFEAGRQIAAQGDVILDGACPPESVPDYGALGAMDKNSNALVIGVLGERSLNDVPHLERLKNNHSVLLTYDCSSLPILRKIVTALLYRCVLTASMPHIDLSFLGGPGTLAEMAIGYHESKILGISRNSGGASNGLKSVLDGIYDSGQVPGDIVYFEEDDPTLLVRRARAEYIAQEFRKGDVPTSRVGVYLHSGRSGQQFVMEIRPAGRPATEPLAHMPVASIELYGGTDVSELSAIAVEQGIRRMGFVPVQLREDRGEVGFLMATPTSTIQQGDFQRYVQPVLHEIGTRYTPLFSQFFDNAA